MELLELIKIKAFLTNVSVKFVSQLIIVILLETRILSLL